MKTLLRYFSIGCLLLSAGSVCGQNVGIGTATPGSSLVVNGSVAAAYRSVTASYALTASDYFVAYNGTVSGTLTLPVALTGGGNFKGRVYKVKNNSAQVLAIAAATGESISGNSVILLAAGNAAEVISTGATTGTTWEVISSGGLTYGTDALRGALATGGCASCAAYDAAAVNAWISITAAEYTAVQGLNGIGVYGASAAFMGGNTIYYISGANTITQNFVQPVLPTANYPVALSIRTSSSGAPTTFAGMVLKTSTTSQTAGYADVPVGAATPNSATTPAINTVYYFVLKRPTTLTAAASNMAIYTPLGFQMSFTTSSGTSYYGTGNIANPTIAILYTSLFQVLATPNKQW